MKFFVVAVLLALTVGQYVQANEADIPTALSAIVGTDRIESDFAEALAAQENVNKDDIVPVGGDAALFHGEIASTAAVVPVPFEDEIVALETAVDEKPNHSSFVEVEEELESEVEDESELESEAEEDETSFLEVEQSVSAEEELEAEEELSAEVEEAEEMENEIEEEHAELEQEEQEPALLEAEAETEVDMDNSEFTALPAEDDNIPQRIAETRDALMAVEKQIIAGSQWARNVHEVIANYQFKYTRVLKDLRQRHAKVIALRRLLAQLKKANDHKVARQQLKEATAALTHLADESPEYKYIQEQVAGLNGALASINGQSNAEIINEADGHLFDISVNSRDLPSSDDALRSISQPGVLETEIAKTQAIEADQQQPEPQQEELQQEEEQQYEEVPVEEEQQYEEVPVEDGQEYVEEEQSFIEQSTSPIMKLQRKINIQTEEREY